MADLMMAKKHLNAVATALDGMGTLTPPPTSKGRWLIVKALPKMVAEAQAYSAELKKWLDTVVTKDEGGNPIYGTANGQVTFNFQSPEDAAHFAEIQNEQVTLTGLRPLTRVELGECPITVAQEFLLVESGFLEDSEPA